ncbi:fimbrillin family protein [Bacteroides sp.]|uniref:fimbrillin family protein n=1 Tax=Bacteroides sp. TaxID=29523 RepID=UPI002584FEF1|nr:fimbrillin family protein [Bacteroides sp.]
MKKQAFICALLATVLLPGCSEDRETTPQPTDGRVALEATSGIRMNTRAYDKTWEAGDAIGIYMLNGGAMDGNGNSKYTTDQKTENGSFTAAEGQTLYFPVDGSQRDFVAYYPYRETLAEGNVYTVDVSHQTPQKDIDLMGAAKVEGKDKLNPKVAFVFTHKLVKLDITIKADGTSLTDAELAGTTVSISNQQTAAAYNVVTGGEATVTAGTPAEIVLHTDGLKAEGIVLPAATTENMVLTFTVPGLGNQAFHWSVNSATKSKEFEAGSKYLYTITIGKAGVEVSSKVEDWTAGNGAGGETGNAE